MASKSEGFDDHIRECRQATDKHLQALKTEIESVINEALKADTDKEQIEAASINKELDAKNQTLLEGSQDEVKRNNEERARQLDLNHTNAENRRDRILKKHRNLNADVVNVAEEIERKICKLERSGIDDIKRKKSTRTLKTIIKDKINKLKGVERQSTSETDELEKQLDSITRTVSGVRFVRGDGREKYNGRIDGYDGEWKLIDTISFNHTVLGPILVGCLDDSTAIISDSLTHNTYSVDINTKRSQIVIPGTAAQFIMLCASLNNRKMACVKFPCIGCTGDSIPDCISVYDSQWNLINDVTIPQNTSRAATLVQVAADQDGMIVAAENGQSKIHVITPADSKIAHTITCKEDMIMRGVLSSGHIIAVTSPGKGIILIIDRNGAHIEIPLSEEILNVCVDPMTDTLYVMTPDVEGKACVIDQLVMSGGDVKRRRVTSFLMSTRLITDDDETWKGHITMSNVMITSSGRILACNAESILVFKKLFCL